ncbi:MAG: hypothetical protein QOF51_396, partial [Chloroflexota bacterium]|nr:hypothetical protein [Chloroflexota bacterium]
MTEPIAEIALVRMAQAASSRRAAPDGGADAGGTTERQRLFADVLGGLLESGPSAKSPSLVKSASAPGASGPDDSSLAMSGLGDASASKSLMMSILLR